VLRVICIFAFPVILFHISLIGKLTYSNLAYYFVYFWTLFILYSWFENTVLPE